MTTLDKRLHVFRPDLADVALQGKVEATRFVTGEYAQFISPITGIHRAPQADAMQISQALFGETSRVFEMANGWAWVQLEADNYVGYVSAASLQNSIAAPTHRVAAPSTHIYPKADIKTQPAISIPMNAKLAVAGQEGDFLKLQHGGFVFANHAVALADHANDFVAVAEKFLHVPYLWGGKSVQGIDCSGLMQVSLQASRLKCPRDSDMQESHLGNARDPSDFKSLKRGDLLFWKGHVGVMCDGKNLLHANAHHMCTVIEPLETAITRISAKGYEVTSIKRL